MPPPDNPIELQKRLDHATREKDNLRNIIEEIQDGFVEVDLEGNIVRFNKAFCDIIGYSHDEVKGLSYKEYLDEGTAANVFNIFYKIYHAEFPNKSFEYEIIRKDGTRRNVETSIALRKNAEEEPIGFSCIIRDVTLRRKIERELVRQRSRLEAIFRSVEDAIITVDTQRTVTEANDAAFRICSITQDKIMGRPFSDNLETCSQSCQDILDETITQKKHIRDHQIQCNHSNRPHQRVSLSCSPLEGESGAFLGAVLVIRDITRLADLERELKSRHTFHSIVGRSRKMQQIFRLIEDVSDFETTVLITGESGTGKELAARAVHYTGRRTFKPFVTVNCSALAESLLESELFGHVKGAFTGAVRDHVGRFQSADKGTILLDEIGDISANIQLKLLRVLQEKEFERVGDSKPISVDVRVIASTNRDLKERVQAGAFREDLYYRLKVVEVLIPP